MFYSKSFFKDLYCVISYNVFLVCFHLSAKVKEYSVDGTHTQDLVQTVFSLFFIAK